MTALFVTGSGTGVGKTLVTAALACQLRAAGHPVAAVKPVVSGFAPDGPSDTHDLLAALGRPATPGTIEAVSPWRFAAPLSPDMAAAREGRRLDLDEIVGFCRACATGDGTLLVEGVGGVMVPLGGRVTVLDWIAALGFPAVLVVGSYLGTLSHTLTAAAALAGRGIALRAVVVSESPESPVPPAETAATLARYVSVPHLVVVPRLHAPSRLWEAAPDLTAIARG